MSLAVVGTGTEVGKTVVSALLLARYKEELPLAYWKPVATGAGDERDSETVRRLAGDGFAVLPERYLFDAPVSPHLAARLEGGEVDVEELLAAFRRHLDAHAPGLVVEGIGGLLVPLREAGDEEEDDESGEEIELLADLLAEVGLPCLLVATSTLGTINHTLLSLEAMRSRGLACPGVVLVGPCDRENRRAIERFGGVPVVGELPPLEPLDAGTLARAAGGFDRKGRLRAYLGGGGGGRLTASRGSR